ncbi:MAG: hypothetical protein E7608_06375 [Ruminococcaceae bacterium]|nr:hypothetical protein [Oscillospiraceae bacterium]
MKKVTPIISIILAMCCMTSCGNVNETVTNGTSSTSVTEITTETTTAANTTVSTTVTSIPNSTTIATTDPMGEQYLLTKENYSLYLSFLNSNNIPKDFITYDQISDIGIFSHFVCLSNADLGDYSHYVYFVKDNNDFNLSVYVERIEDIISTENVLMNENPLDYRNISTEEKGVIIANGVKYVYVKGQLFSIDIQYGNFKITLDGNLMDYPTNGEDTFISRLLSPATAKAAAAEFVIALAK